MRLVYAILLILISLAMVFIAVYELIAVLGERETETRIVIADGQMKVVKD